MAPQDSAFAWYDTYRPTLNTFKSRHYANDFSLLSLDWSPPPFENRLSKRFVFMYQLSLQSYGPRGKEPHLPPFTEPRQLLETTLPAAQLWCKTDSRYIMRIRACIVRVDVPEGTSEGHDGAWSETTVLYIHSGARYKNEVDEDITTDLEWRAKNLGDPIVPVQGPNGAWQLQEPPKRADTSSLQQQQPTHQQSHRQPFGNHSTPKLTPYGSQQHYNQDVTMHIESNQPTRMTLTLDRPTMSEQEREVLEAIRTLNRGTLDNVIPLLERLQEVEAGMHVGKKKRVEGGEDATPVPSMKILNTPGANETALSPAAEDVMTGPYYTVNDGRDMMVGDQSSPPFYSANTTPSISPHTAKSSITPSSSTVGMPSSGTPSRGTPSKGTPTTNNSNASSPKTADDDATGKVLGFELN
ncbi:hypothetical protein HDV00_003643 [Rhizophlyctis rosea]|nr:hypothetical protein HDV00_003643 [Rhizophlyctis rosea]